MATGRDVKQDTDERWEQVRERWSGWGVRLSFGALLLVFSEWVVWQTPFEYNLIEWIALAAVYLALAAAMLDLIARFNVGDVFGLLLVAGIYGVLNATLISRVTAHDLPLSLIGRPLSAQPLAFWGALAAFQVLASGRATGPLDFGAALGVGLAWGVWVRWFPVVSDEPIPAVEIGPALVSTGLLLGVCGTLRLALPPAEIFRRADWLLTSTEWVLTGGALLAALVVGAARGEIDNAAIALVFTLVGFMAAMLWMMAHARRRPSFLARLTPPRRPNLVAWLVLIGPFLAAGWIGFSLGGTGDSSAQSELLFGALTGFGVVWLPAVSIVIGVRAFIQLTREGG